MRRKGRVPAPQMPYWICSLPKRVLLTRDLLRAIDWGEKGASFDCSWEFWTVPEGAFEKTFQFEALAPVERVCRVIWRHQKHNVNGRERISMNCL